MACNSAWIRPPENARCRPGGSVLDTYPGQDRSTGAVARLFVAALSGTIFAK
jgi:hypothetical protein